MLYELCVSKSNSVAVRNSLLTIIKLELSVSPTPGTKEYMCVPDESESTEERRPTITLEPAFSLIDEESRTISRGSSFIALTVTVAVPLTPKPPSSLALIVNASSPK